MGVPSGEKYAKLDSMAEEFAERWRRGERPPLQEFIDRQPDLADDIRELFPALVEMARAEPDGPPRVAAPAAPALRQVGEYRIVREIGRGGMGVVYEAEQTSLSRRVALKILPAHVARDGKALGRFQREARAAAKLHHTNIVPVFEVGQDGDVCYYAMQFIQGQSLDQVIEELRRLRAQSAASRGRPSGRTGLPERPEEKAPAVSRITQALLAGGSQPGEAAKSAGQTTTAALPSLPDAGAAPASSGSAILPDRMALSGAESHHRHFFRSAARIGQQAALALAYAHQRGVLHRDVKPSNLLLDEAGVVWVADFGLAKTDDDGLTATGDVIGTFRYMAPERFSGQGDARSDVYALGLTLYELLTLRPAFDSADRLALVALVKSQDPPRPRSLDPRIPRELETIVLKATAKEPERRYPTAEEMAEDLRRFVADEPIRARRTGGLGRLRLWRRRNPALAALTACLLLLLVGIAAGALVAVFFLNAERTATLNNLHRAQTAEADLKVQLRKTSQAEQEKTDKLWQSYFDRARAGFFSRQVGQRLDGLDALAAAARIRPADQLRDQAIACMALVDLRTVPSGITLPEGATCEAFDRQGARYAYGDKTGAVWVRRVGDGGEITRVPVKGSPPAWLVFSPDGRFLAGGPPSWTFIWDAEQNRVIVAPLSGCNGFDFSPDGRTAAVGRNGDVHLYDLPSGRERFAIPTGFGGLGLAFHPDGRRLAVTGPGFQSSAVRVYDADTGVLLQEMALPETAASPPSWHTDGERLAVGGDYGRVFILHVPDKRMLAVLEGHAQNVVEVHFTADGDHLLTRSWDGTVRLWEAATGRQLLSRAAPITLDMHLDSPRLGYFTDRNRGVQFLELAGGREYRTLAADLGAGQGIYRQVAFSPDGRLLAAGMDDGVRLWDLPSGREVAHLQSQQCSTLAFTPDGGALLTCGHAVGLQRWPIRPDPAAPNGLVIGPAHVLMLPITPDGFQLAADGRTAAVASRQTRDAMLIDVESEQIRPFRLGNPMSGSAAISPDGRWAASCGWHAPAQRIWDAHTGRMVKEFTLGEATGVFFSPDSRWLITTRPEEYCFWDVETWLPGRRIPRDQATYPGPVAFSRDGKMMAVELTPGVISLLDWKTDRTLARLEDPTHDGTGLYFSPDGAELAAVAGNDKALHIWDLRRIRDHLAEMHLEGDWPAYPPAPPPAPALTIDVNMGDLLQQIPADPLVVQARQDAKAKDYAKAAADLHRALAIAPDHPEANNDLAWLLLTGPQELRDAKGALPLARKAVEKAPEQSLYLNTLGVALYRNGQCAEAVPVLEKSLKASNGESDAFDLFFLAMCRHRLGDADRAKEDRDRAVRWVTDHKATLPPAWTEELAAFQAEADAVLARPPGPGDK